MRSTRVIYVDRHTNKCVGHTARTMASPTSGELPGKAGCDTEPCPVPWSSFLYTYVYICKGPPPTHTYMNVGHTARTMASATSGQLPGSDTEPCPVPWSSFLYTYVHIYKDPPPTGFTCTHLAPLGLIWSPLDALRLTSESPDHEQTQYPLPFQQSQTLPTFFSKSCVVHLSLVVTVCHRSRSNI